MGLELSELELSMATIPEFKYTVAPTQSSMPSVAIILGAIYICTCVASAVWPPGGAVMVVPARPVAPLQTDGTDQCVQAARDDAC